MSTSALDISTITTLSASDATRVVSLKTSTASGENWVSSEAPMRLPVTTPSRFMLATTAPNTIASRPSVRGPAGRIAVGRNQAGGGGDTSAWYRL